MDKTFEKFKLYIAPFGLNDADFDILVSNCEPMHFKKGEVIMSGATTNEIAKRLELKPNTVSTFKKKIFAKFHVDSDVDLYKILKEN